ncbi:SWIM zinc finger family protein [Haloarchaeobius amylolyticus]|uniref:SWIM zinc finger family protein n=1 Tax=Haloarchaeobius amylolyticus TaxID=1198296 RepID=UPI002270BB17|nr:SWIM zinc finger family protein [Haloarchaeobius amylolyticus]
MSTNPLSKLKYLTRVGKRAQYEAFEFELTPAGVRIRNCSHANPSEHEYLVTVDDGVPSSCTCPANANYDGACKHRIAVAIRQPVLESATQNQLVADGGTRPAKSSVDSEDSSSLEDCDCDSLTDGFPCWPCYRDEKRDFENE